MRELVLGLATLAGVGVIGWGIWKMVQQENAPPSVPEADDVAETASSLALRAATADKFFGNSVALAKIVGADDAE